MDWIQRRKARDLNLLKAEELWQQVITEIQNCCNSFKKEYAHIGDLRHVPENGHSMKLALLFTGGNSPPSPHAPTKMARITFDSDEPSIIVTVEGDAKKEFKIDADEKGCFLSRAKQPISLEDFSEQALQEFLFGGPRQIHQPYADGGKDHPF